jgi:hypothetical protein
MTGQEQSLAESRARTVADLHGAGRWAMVGSGEALV